MTDETAEGVVIGYNLQKEYFIIKRLDHSGRMQTYRLPFSMIEKALYDSAEPNVKLHFWYYKKETVPQMDVSVICRYLQDYINSRNSRARNPQGLPYGIAAIEALISECQQGGRGGDGINLRHLQAFYEHKYFMWIRMQYLTSQNLIPSDIESIAKDVYDLSKNILEIGKSIMTRCCYEEMPKMLALMRQTIAIERKYLSEVVNYMQTYDTGEKGVGKHLANGYGAK